MYSAIPDSADRNQQSTAAQRMLTTQQPAGKTRLHSSLYEIHTRPILTEFSRELGRHVTLVDITDGELDRLAQEGFNLLSFLGVWKTGTAESPDSQLSHEISSEHYLTLAEKTCAVPASQFRRTKFILISVVIALSNACVSAFICADCVCCSIRSEPHPSRSRVGPNASPMHFGDFRGHALRWTGLSARQAGVIVGSRSVSSRQ